MYFQVREIQSGLGDWSDWYPVTQSATGTGASLLLTDFNGHFRNDALLLHF